MIQKTVRETKKLRFIDVKKRLGSLKEYIRKKYKAEIIGIFGSYVRGEEKKESDLDVLVKFFKGATLFDFVGLSLFLQENLKIKNIDIIPYDTVREEIKKDIFNEVVRI